MFILIVCGMLCLFTLTAVSVGDCHAVL
jgi:hypothetical protein